MGSERKAFEDLLREAVVEGLGVLGESGRRAVLYHLEKSYGVTVEKIEEMAQAFNQALRAIFGPGANILERGIVERLYAKAGMSFEEKPGYRFGDYIRECRGRHSAP